MTAKRPESAATLIHDFLATGEESTPAADSIDSPGHLSEWLVTRGLLERGDDVSIVDVEQAQRVRAAIRSFIAAFHGAEEDPHTAQTLSNVTAYAPLTISIHGRAISTESRVAGVPGALATIVGCLYRVAVAGDLERLKVCRMCGQPFYDNTRNKSRVWCSMDRCGGKSKYRAFQERRRAGSRHQITRPAHSPGTDATLDQAAL
jgi:predicted RNA-binding Zn ribbon-like protein